jgi:hypothetical protein
MYRRAGFECLLDAARCQDSYSRWPGASAIRDTPPSDDRDPAFFPGAADPADGLDQDCDGGDL